VYWDYLVQLAALRLGTLPIASFARFSAVGLTGAAVDMGLLYLLSDPRSLGLSLTLSKLAAAEVAMLNNFLWNDAWTFRIFVKGQRTLRAKCKRFVKFNFICGLGLIFSLILLNVQTRWLGIDRYIANGIAILAVTLWNFSINRKLNWRVTEVGAGAPSHWPAHATPPGPQ
jgi:dolichol-phosphate mannosyltransferase